MSAKSRISGLLLTVLLGPALGGCAHTRITTDDPNARVYVDGVALGRGSGEVSQTGLPGSAQVLVKAIDGRTARAEMRRQFGAGTFFLGFITYGVCWFACWSYPDSFHVPLAPATPGASSWGDATGATADDPWMRSPAGWSAPQVARPTAPAPSASERADATSSR